MHPAPELDIFRSIVETVADYAIFAMSTDGTILTWNRGAQVIKGYSAAEIVGRSFTVFHLQEALASNYPAHELEIATRDGRFEDEGWRLRKDGSRFWAHVLVTALRDRAGDLLGFAKITADLTRRKQEAEALRQSEERFRLMVQAVKDYAMLMLDADGRVVSWNEGAQRMKGYAPEEIIGRSFEVFYPPHAVASGFPRKELDAAVREGCFEDEGWRVRKDGTPFWANVVITALYGTGGQLVGFCKVTRDLTARREAEEKQRQLAAEQAAHAAAAQRADELHSLSERLATALEHAEMARHETEHAYRELDQFAYVTSHDLKAPLRGIGTLAQWIEEDLADRLSGESADHMRLLRGRVHRLQALIDGILAYSRAGRVLGAPERIDTGKLVREVIELQAPGDAVKFDIAPHMPVVEAERIPLQQVFMNLIGNAIKYTRAVREDVGVALAWRDAGDRFEFSVTDNGPGIPPEFHERIWGVFQTLEPRDKVEGAGIGLAVVKKIVEARGGTVTVESGPGEGTTFRFTWPRQREESPA